MGGCCWQPVKNSGEELKRKLQESMGSLPRELERQMAKLVSLIQKREELREEKQRRDQEAIRFKQDYEEAYHAFLEEQAGLLARDLQEGHALPRLRIFASPPRPAGLSATAPDQQQVERKKKRMEQAVRQADQIRDVLQKAGNGLQRSTSGMRRSDRPWRRKTGTAERAGESGRRKKKAGRREIYRSAGAGRPVPGAVPGNQKTGRTRLESGKKCWKFYRENSIRADETYRRCRENDRWKTKDGHYKSQGRGRADKRKEAAAGRKKPPSFCPLSEKQGDCPADRRSERGGNQENAKL